MRAEVTKRGWKVCKILVCGGREYTNKDQLNRTLTRFHREDPIDILITGGATGADTLAARWAHRNFVNNEQHWAQWTKYGRAAGPIRNTKMLKESQPDCIIAFKGAAGTRDMINKALLAGLPVWEVDDDNTGEEDPDIQKDA